tara:strand:+ start:118 stop:588 length:471 start_codon:yes stop_codon:yes gene_type:complete
MSKGIKTLNLREGSFPIKMDLMFQDIDLQNIGCLKDSIFGNIKISKISKDLFRCEGSINGIFTDKCRSCLKSIEVNLNVSCNLVIKDESLMMDDNSSQDQTHYQNLENFNTKQLIQEEISLNYPNFVKCEENCLKLESLEKEEKNLPFEKIRDLID